MARAWDGGRSLRVLRAPASPPLSSSEIPAPRLFSCSLSCMVISACGCCCRSAR